MENNTNNSQKQQFSTKPSTEIKPTNTKQNRPYTNWRKRHEDLDFFHPPQPKNKKNHQFIQTHKQSHRVPDHNYIVSTHKIHNAKSNTRTQKSGVYKLTCNKCHRSYIGQTNQNLKLRFQEHTHYIKHNEPQSVYALHILNCRHEYSNISNTMTLLKHINKLSILLPYEQKSIQLFHHNSQLIPEQHPNEQNPIFQLLHNRYHTSHST